MLVLQPMMVVLMDTKGVGPLSMVGVGVMGVGEMSVGVMGVSVKVGWGDGVKVDVSLGDGGVSDGVISVDGNVAVIGGGRMIGVGE